MTSGLHKFAISKLRMLEIPDLHTFTTSELRRFMTSGLLKFALRSFAGSRFQIFARSRLRSFAGSRFQTFASSIFLKTCFTNFINLDVLRVTGFPKFPYNILEPPKTHYKNAFVPKPNHLNRLDTTPAPPVFPPQTNNF
jgi:hypothetical protein